MSEPLPPDPNVVDQQRRVISATRQHTRDLLTLLGTLADDMQYYTWLGLGDDAILLDEAFEGTGTDREAYRAAIVSLEAIAALLDQGHGSNLSRFAI